MSESFLEESISVLHRTPAVLDALLRGLDGSWIYVTEGRGTWSPYDVLGHLIYADRTDWMTRLRIILEHGPNQPFDRFDREAQFRQDQSKTLDDLLDEFRVVRADNLRKLRQLELTGDQL